MIDSFSKQSGDAVLIQRLTAAGTIAVKEIILARPPSAIGTAHKITQNQIADHPYDTDNDRGSFVVCQTKNRG